jgi:iron complex transport system ATP-binding protein
LLLLDAPAAGLDMRGRVAVLAAPEAAAGDDAGDGSDALRVTSVLVTHHLEEVPSTTTHALLLAHGRAVAAGAIGDVLTEDALSRCFGLPVSVEHHDGRWFARAAPGWRDR